RQFLSLCLILALAFSAFAQQKSAAEPVAPLVERIRGHISYLASDKLEGRRTGSAGANMAAEYIAREFSRYGLRRSVGRDLPGMSILEADSPRRYMQEFPFVAGVELGRNNSMLFNGRAVASTAAAQDATSSPTRAGSLLSVSLDLRTGEDWMPLGFSTSAKLADLPAAFVGYGIKASELNYDDYARARVAGRIAIALSGTPDGDNPHGQFARYADARWKAIAAREQGAAALVLISAEENFKDDRLARLSYDNSAGEAGLPVAVISRQAAARFFGLGGIAQLGEFEMKFRELMKARPAPGTEQPDVKVTIRPEFDFTISLSTDIVRRNAAAYNVAGILEGSDPVLKNEVVVIGAHYDHLGLGGEGSLAPREGEIHHGADDNASGVAGVLELARIFSREGMKPKRTLVFVAFSGEEEGLLGSNYFVNHMVVPLSQTVAMINMDMIGRMKENRLIIGGVGTAGEWREWIEAKNREVVTSKNADGLKAATVIAKFNLTLNEDGYGPSDHSSFYAKQVPVLFFFTGTHDDYHKPTDTAEKINYEDEARVLAFVASLVRSIDAEQKRPTYTIAKSDSQGRSMGFRVYLGTIPNYSESSDGLKLDGVREDSPASKAGLKAGDRITRMAGREVRNVYDYTYALGEMKAGQEYDVEIVRGTETLKLKITPASRK
ncbi:MAG TPA: M20/M25/M40 family metallo-hydrolase, partial [Pyrinomonadaceae bacterium]|nr:M20/M25/M40 family metallo-hydrolase [Pyrinomonadaceae bacterium]